MLIRFNSVPESVGKSNGRSGDWKFLFFGISKKSGYVQLFLLVIFYLIFFWYTLFILELFSTTCGV